VTSGVLLRMLSSDDGAQDITHAILVSTRNYPPFIEQSRGIFYEGKDEQIELASQCPLLDRVVWDCPCSRSTVTLDFLQDEVHERELNTDHLLIVLRQALKKRNDLKVSSGG
jgi:hypothetical protein